MPRVRGVISLLSVVATLVIGVHCQSDAVEVTITFDRVTVSGIETDLLTNKAVHALDPTETTDAAPSGEERSDGVQSAVPNRDQAKGPTHAPQSGAPAPQAAGKTAPSATRPSQDPANPSKGAANARDGAARVPSVPRRLVPAPGAGVFNPSFIENGFLVESFWAVNTGDPAGYFVRGHFHPKNLETGFEAQHYGGSRELHGIFIRALDGRPFSLKSLSYRVTHNRELGRSQSVQGFSNYDVKVLIATDFSAKRSVLGQFIHFSVGPPISNDSTLPFQTLPIGGFAYVTQVFIASSASVDFDDIVIEVGE
jgi:hypothetical protein